MLNPSFLWTLEGLPAMARFHIADALGEPEAMAQTW